MSTMRDASITVLAVTGLFWMNTLGIQALVTL